MTQRTCPVCGGSRLAPIAEVPSAPVFCNVLSETRSAALRAPSGSISLATCRDCSHIFNTAFDEGLVAYSPEYENSLHFSPTFQSYAQDLANRLVDEFDIRGRQVVELGCGKGDFLAMLADAGDNEAIGFDPSYDGAVDQHFGRGSVRVIRDTYAAAGRDLRPSLVVGRHVLEHLTDPSMLLTELQQWRTSDPIVYLEVPNADHMVENEAYWDVIYEHPSYFTARSLSRLCTDNSLSPIRIESSFGNQYLSAHARIGASEAAAPRSVADSGSFGDGLEQAVAKWSDRLGELSASGRQAAIWGAGSKGVSFASLVAGAADSVAVAVDLNPRKAGRYMPVSAIPVVLPDDDRLTGVSLVLVMNPIYEAEIRSDLISRGIRASVEVVS